jgi:arylsulfatase A-like enzyme
MAPRRHGRYHPTRRGFDEFFGFLHEGRYCAPPPWPAMVTWLRRKALPDGTRGRWASPDGGLVYPTHLGNNEPDYDADNPLLRNSQPVDERAYLTDALTREAVGFIARHRHQPFFLEVAYNAVHSPMQAPADALARFGRIKDIHRRIFAAMLARLDEGVGRIRAALRDQGLGENTLVVFLSDNGGPTRELTSSNLPLRGEKGGLYEGGIRVPFLMSWKGRLPAGRVDDRPVSALDVLPTALAAAGVSPPGDARSLDGVDLLPYLTDARRGRPHDRLYWRVGPKAALRLGDWKLVRDAGRRAQDAWQLFDLSNDPAERHDLAAREPAKVRELETEWDALDVGMVEPLWGGGAARPRPAGARGR